MDSNKKLNKAQLKAVKHGKGPLLIIAGAGTGKTTVITERIKYLISKELVKPEEILALTFTDKAAREMEERVDQALPYGYTNMWISTFHSFCDRVLRDEAIQIGLDPGFKLMTQSETTQFLIDNLFNFKLDYFRPRGNPTKFVGGLIAHFSRLKDEDVLPEQYLKFAQKVALKAKTQEAKAEAKKTSELARAYTSYENFKIKKGFMDYGDLITNTLQLFRTRKNILKRYQQQFKYILVDEFQDTNIAQNGLVILLAGKRPNLTVVADDDQSIYKWRGAAISNVIQFKKTFPKTKIVTLTQNYRSTQEILDKAYQLIQNNNPDRLEVKENIDKKLTATRKVAGKPIEFLYSDRVENEAEAVTKQIVNLTSEKGGCDFKDIAILVRANNHAEAFVRALSRAGVPYQFLGPGQLFRQAEVKDLMAYLFVLDNFEDNVSLFRVLSMEHFELSGRDLAAINNFSRRTNLSLFESCEKVGSIYVTEKTRQTIANFVQMVHGHLNHLSKATAGQILYYFLEDSGLLKKITEYKTPLEERQAQNIAKFFDRLKSFEVTHEDASVRAVVAWLKLSMELGESPLATDMDWTQENRVNLLTVHSAKGLEFPVVFLVNLVAARFPSRARSEQIPLPEDLIKEILPSGDFHQQEERRLFYVGMTRARDRLFLTAANYYGEGKREKKVSPFVIEALGPQTIQQVKDPQTEQLGLLDWATSPPRQSGGQAASVPAELTTTPLRLSINYLSYSQINTFDTCPLQYKYRYIHRIPVPASAAATFGDTVHRTLKDFYQLVKNGQKPTRQQLIGFLNKNWSSVGYRNKKHEQKMKKQGERMLAKFYQKGYNPTNPPQSLEQIFTIRATPMLKVGGRIDRVDKTPKGIEIYDYKTGKVWDQKQVDESLQMTVYALAAADPGIFNQNPETVTLSFYFLENNQKISTKRSRQQLNKAKQEFQEKAQEISQTDFQATPGPWCDWCDYKMVCEAWS